MIAKRIRKGPRRARGAITQIANNVIALARYVVDADPWAMARSDDMLTLSAYALHIAEQEIEPGEKVQAYGARNLRGHDLRGWQAQMTAIAARGVRNHDPIEHIVYSWRADETPTAEQVEEAGAIILEVMGYGRCPAIWSWHSNTANAHGHLAIVRIDPASGKVAGDGWDIDRLHQALALIEERQGWSREPNALYRAQGGEVFNAVTGEKIRDRDGRQVGRRGRGLLPATFAARAIDIRQVAMIATNWTDLHRRLAHIHVVYRKKGSGAVIEIGDERIKASQVHRSLGRAMLERRLGAFQSDTSQLETAFKAYESAYREGLAQLRYIESFERGRLRKWYDQAIETHPTENWLARSIRAERASALRDLNATFRVSKAAYAASRLTTERWRTSGRPASPPPPGIPSLLLPAGDFDEHRVTDPAGFEQRHYAWRTDYLGQDGQLAFRDLRSAIIVNADIPDAMDAALMLAAERWRAVRVTGNAAVQKFAAERAALLGISLFDESGQQLNVHRGTVKVRTVSQAPSTAGLGTPKKPTLKQSSRQAAPSTSTPVSTEPVSTTALAIETDIPFDAYAAWLQARRDLGR